MIVISYEKRTVSYETFSVSYEKFPVSYETFTVSYVKFSVSYEKTTVSYEKIVVSYDLLLVSSEMTGFGDIVCLIVTDTRKQKSGPLSQAAGRFRRYGEVLRSVETRVKYLLINETHASVGKPDGERVRFVHRQRPRFLLGELSGLGICDFDAHAGNGRI